MVLLPRQGSSLGTDTPSKSAETKQPVHEHSRIYYNFQTPMRHFSSRTLQTDMTSSNPPYNQGLIIREGVKEMITSYRFLLAAGIQIVTLKIHRIIHFVALSKIPILSLGVQGHPQGSQREG